MYLFHSRLLFFMLAHFAVLAAKKGMQLQTNATLAKTEQLTRRFYALKKFTQP